MELTDREKIFCLHYVEFGNIADAGRAAGYNSIIALNRGLEILQREHVKAYIKMLKDKLTVLTAAGKVINGQPLTDLERVTLAEALEKIKADEAARRQINCQLNCQACTNKGNCKKQHHEKANTNRGQ